MPRLLPAILVAVTCAAAPPPSVDFRHGDLRVSDNHRFLVHADGTPFFYLGDTAWEIFHRLNREDTEKYLENRRQKGFNVIQSVALAEFDGLNAPNAFGEKPLTGNDPTTPNEAYFKHVDWVVNTARSKGLYIGMLPTWGDKVYPRNNTPVIFNAENARVYGRFLGARYKDAPNIIWILGGDRPAPGVEAVWRAMAEGLKEGDGGRHLKTFHPNGRHSSGDWLHDEPWLDFNMLQSGHASKDFANYEMISKDYQRTPAKPVFDGEPRYDDLENRLAQGPIIAVPTITLEGDANGAPHLDPAAYAKKFSGKYAHRTLSGGIGHNLPQEAPQAFAQAVVDVDRM